MICWVKASQFCTTTRGSCTKVHVQYCKQFGSDTRSKADIILAVFYSLTEEYFPNVPPKAKQ